MSRFILLVMVISVMMESASIGSPTVFISIDSGAFFSNPNHSNDINLKDALGNIYSAKSGWQYDGNVILGFGLRTFDRHDFALNTGIRFIPNISMSGNGDVVQLRLPQFRNLAYTYEITNNFLFLDNTMTWTKHRIQPGIILGLGRAVNSALNYHETPLTSHAASSLGYFQDSKHAQFAYEVGAVLDYSMNEVVIECAYRYLNAGGAQLGLSPLQNTQEHLHTGILQYQAISIGVRVNHAL